MDFYHTTEPPVRENRLQATNCYGGTVSDILKKQCQGGCACFANSSRRFRQTQLCQSSLCLSFANSIEDCVIIVHAPIGCGGMNMHTRELFSENNPLIRYPRTINTNLSEADVISGGEEKLRQAVLWAEKKFHPTHIIIIATCTPTLMGDDIDGILKSLQGQVSANLIPIYCAGFKSKIIASFYDAMYHGLIRTFLQAPKNPSYTGYTADGKPIVNLFRMSSASDADLAEMKRLLHKLGLKVRILAYGAKAQDFQEMTNAVLNISMCATHDDYMLTFLKENFQIPYLIKNIPVGVTNTSLWLRSIAAFFGKENLAETIIQEETAELQMALNPLLPNLRGKRVYLHGGEIRVLAMAETMDFLGLEVVGIEARHHDAFATDLLEAWRQKNETLSFAVASGQPFERANLLERLQPDLCIGHKGQCVWPAKQGIPVFPLFNKPEKFFGYEGVYSIACGLHRLFQNTIFYKNIRRHLPLPYQTEWYAKDPFFYITTEETVF